MSLISFLFNFVYSLHALTGLILLDLLGLMHTCSDILDPNFFRVSLTHTWDDAAWKWMRLLMLELSSALTVLRQVALSQDLVSLLWSHIFFEVMVKFESFTSEGLNKCISGFCLLKEGLFRKKIRGIKCINRINPTHWFREISFFEWITLRHEEVPIGSWVRSFRT